MANCKSCGARIVWMNTSTNGRIPVNYSEEVLHFEYFNPKAMITHFATCPNAEKHRKVASGRED